MTRLCHKIFVSFNKCANGPKLYHHLLNSIFLDKHLSVVFFVFGSSLHYVKHRKHFLFKIKAICKDYKRIKLIFQKNVVYMSQRSWNWAFYDVIQQLFRSQLNHRAIFLCLQFTLIFFASLKLILDVVQKNFFFCDKKFTESIYFTFRQSLKVVWKYWIWCEQI